jgi:hypothetical protein
MAVVYFDRKTEVEVGDRVEFRLLFRRRAGTVAYVPGKSPRNANLEHHGLTWVGIRIDGGGVTAAVVDPVGQFLQRKVRFLARGSVAELTPDEDPFED